MTASTPNRLPLCPHNPADDWGHGTMSILRNPITDKPYAVAGFCRLCRRPVKFFPPPESVSPLQTGVADQRVEDTGDNRPNGLRRDVVHGAEDGASGMPGAPNDDGEDIPKGGNHVE